MIHNLKLARAEPVTVYENNKRFSVHEAGSQAFWRESFFLRWGNCAIRFCKKKLSDLQLVAVSVDSYAVGC